MPQCRSLTKTLHCRKPDETVRPAKIPKQCECITRGFLHVQAIPVLLGEMEHTQGQQMKDIKPDR